MPPRLTHGRAHVEPFNKKTDALCLLSLFVEAQPRELQSMQTAISEHVTDAEFDDVSNVPSDATPQHLSESRRLYDSFR